jgi:hypothetical protein
MPYSTGMRLATRSQIVQALAAANYTGATGSGTYISLKDVGHVTIIIQTGGWAGGTAAVTINQATDVAGDGAKALAFTQQYTDVASVGNGLVATAVTSNTFNLSAANATHVIEVDAASLDLVNSFDCLSVQVASPGSNNDYYAGVYVLDGPVRYAGNTPPLATSN